MSRAAVDDPMFRTLNGAVEFTPDMQSPSRFETYMPGMTYYDALKIDTTMLSGDKVVFDFDTLDRLGEAVNRAKKEGTSVHGAIRDMIDSPTSDVMMDLQEIAAIDVIRALRGVIGQVAVTVGFLDHEMRTKVRNAYAEPLVNVAAGLQVVGRVINSEYFQQAIDGISWIPIVGWIIKIVVEVLTLIVNISAKVREKRITKMTTELALRFHLPLMAADVDIKNAYNQTLTQGVLKAVKEYNAQAVFLPPVIAPNGSGRAFEAVAAADEDAGKEKMENGEERTPTAGWYLRGSPESMPGGIGFVPGGSTIFRQFEFVTGGGGNEPRNIGDYAPTAKQTAAYLWQLALKPGPLMFAVETAPVREAWDAFVHALWEYRDRCVRNGFTTTEWSTKTTHGYDDCSGRYWLVDGKKAGYKRTLSGDVNHLEVMWWAIVREFWGRGPDQMSFPVDIYKGTPTSLADDFYYQNTVYATALRNLHDRQKSVVRGYDAFEVFPGGEVDDLDYPLTGKKDDWVVFPAFGKPGHWNKDLINKWENTIITVLGDKALWQNVDYRTVPQYKWKGQSVREILRERQGASDHPFVGATQFATPQSRIPVPGGPEAFPPPTPPAIVGEGREELTAPERDTSRRGRVTQQRGGLEIPTATKAMFAAAAAMGFVVGGNELYRRYKRLRPHL